MIGGARAGDMGNTPPKPLCLILNCLPAENGLPIGKRKRQSKDIYLVLPQGFPLSAMRAARWVLKGEPIIPTHLRIRVSRNQVPPRGVGSSLNFGVQLFGTEGSFLMGHRGIIWTLRDH